MTDTSQAVAPVVSVAAYINHGRWVVQCPACGSAELLNQGDPSYMCDPNRGGCGNIDHAGMRITVTWPADPDAIVAVLGLRPDRLRQNWFPHETVADLAAENVQHGLAPGVV